jgi:hypothetical protein
MSRLASTAAAAFREALTDLGFSDEQSDISDPTELGRRAALLVASELVWQRQIGPLLDGAQARQLLGVRTRQAVDDLVKRGGLLGLPSRDGSIVFPAFQFSAEGRPLPALPAILAIFSGVVERPYTIASWFVTPPTAPGRRDAGRLAPCGARSGSRH